MLTGYKVRVSCVTFKECTHTHTHTHTHISMKISTHSCFRDWSETKVKAKLGCQQPGKETSIMWQYMYVCHGTPSWSFSHLYDGMT